MNWRAFRTLIFREIKTSSLDLMDKMCYLLSFCTVLNYEHNIYGLWIELNWNEIINANDIYYNNKENRVLLKLIISLSHYMSNTTLEPTLQKITTEINEKIYFLIQIFEDNAFSKGPLLTMRVDRFGEFGELVWIQKGKLLSGQTMLNFCVEFINYFQIKSCYLMDSAQINLSNIPFNTKDGRKYDLKNNKKYKYKKNNHQYYKKKGHLRLIHILSSYHGDDEDIDIDIGQTWYQQHAEFKPINIKKWPLVPTRNNHRNNNNNKHETITQNLNKYEKSIKYIRNFKLNDIQKHLTNEQKLHISAMIEYYKEYKFDHDIKNKINQQNEKFKDEHKQNLYTLLSSSEDSSSSSEDSDTNNNNDNNGWIKQKNINVKIMTQKNQCLNWKMDSKLPLKTVHDLVRRVHCCAFYAPTKFGIFIICF